MRFIMRKKNYKGTAPDLKEWEFIGDVNHESINWKIFKKITLYRKWTSYKLVSTKTVKFKGNYLLAWNGDRFAESKCYNAIIDHRPDLFDKFCDAIGL